MSEPNQTNSLLLTERPLQPGDAFVAICDWNGVVRWLSNHTVKTQVGDLGWSNMIPEDAERFKEAFARTASLREPRVLEIASLNGLRYRIWLWSVGTPELAVCTFNLLIPKAIEQLTDRESELMRNLAPGKALKEVACEMDISINTLHAHVRSIRNKLDLVSTNEVLAYASRFFSHPDQSMLDSKNGSVSGKQKLETAQQKKQKATRRR